MILIDLLFFFNLFVVFLVWARVQVWEAISVHTLPRTFQHTNVPLRAPPEPSVSPAQVLVAYSLAHGWAQPIPGTRTGICGFPASARGRFIDTLCLEWGDSGLTHLANVDGWKAAQGWGCSDGESCVPAT